LSWLSLAGCTAALKKTPKQKVIRLCLENKLVVLLALLALIGWGIMVAPSDWELDFLPRGPVPVDAIPDIGEKPANSFY